MAFSKASLDFLMENRINDSRLWFNEHRAEYIEYVRDPMRSFVNALVPCFEQIDPMIVCDPVRSVSRIFRDARYSKTIFRETLWCSFSRDKHRFDSIPSYFFEITPVSFSYGCGCYRSRSDFMTEMRGLILSGSTLFTEARLSVEASGLELINDRYKRTKCPDAPEWQRPWLDLKSPCVIAGSTDLDELYSDKLAEEIGKAFMSVKPFYDFLLYVSNTLQ